MKAVKSLAAFFILVGLFYHMPVHADDSMATYIEVEPEPDLTAPYKERRTRHGFILSGGTQKYYPDDYQSMQDGNFIEDFLGDSPIDMMNLELGYKLNFGLGSLALTGGFAKGQFSNTFENLQRKVDIQKIEFMAYYFADNLFREPWVVPYVAVGINRFTVTESMTGAADVVKNLAPTGAIRVGMEFQLNWIDRDGSADAYQELGLENTFLDLYLARNTVSSKLAADFTDPEETGDPDTSNRFQLGMGLRLEF